MGAAKVALIVGTGGGLDVAVAAALVEKGMSVELFVHGGRKMPDVPVPVQLTALDITDEGKLAAAVQAFTERKGRVDCLINCPDLRINRPLAETTAQEWDDSVALNLTAVFLACKHVVPLMVKQGAGRVVNVSSDVARMGALNSAAYAAAKAGLITFSKSLTREVADFGVRVNVVSLGMMGEDIATFGSEADISAIPLKRAGKWEEAAYLVRCITDEKLEYMTGQTVHMNGGLYMP